MINVNIRFVLFVFPLMLLVLGPFGGCSRGRTKGEVLRALSKDVAFVREFNATFPGTPQFVAHQTGGYGDQVWHTTVGVLDRYTLTIHLPLVWDDEKGELLSYEEPLFYFREVESVQLTSEGGIDVTYNAKFACIQNFTIDQWNTLLECEGDFSKAFPCFENDRPVNNFSDFLKQKYGI